MKNIVKYYFVVTFIFSLAACETAQHVLSGMDTGNGSLSAAEIASGLKEALTIGTRNSSDRLSAVDGFLGNASVKILMPEEAKKVESTLRNIGLGGLVDKAVLSINRAAEEASKSATPIFVDAIKQMTITDAMGILKGGDYAATDYFKAKTTVQLSNAFRPVIEKALSKTNATKYWEDVFGAYNKFAAKPINTDLAGYVTEKAISGIFYEVGLEEQKIRKDPAARVTELLKKVFG